MPHSLEWHVVFLFLSYLCRKVLKRDPRERKGTKPIALLLQLGLENLSHD